MKARWRFWRFGGAFVLAVVAIRATLPWLVEGGLERRLGSLEGLDGEIQDVDLALLRGRLAIDGLSLWEVPTGKGPGRSVAWVERIETRLSWRDLRRGLVVVSVSVRRPVVDFVRRLNPQLRELGKFDAQSGEFDVLLEAAAERGRLKGYVTPVIRGLVVSGSRERGRQMLQRLWERALGAGVELIENRERSQLAARIPFAGTIQEPEAGLWAGVASVFENGFVRALSPMLEGSIDLDDLRSAPRSR